MLVRDAANGGVRLQRRLGVRYPIHLQQRQLLHRPKLIDLRAAVVVVPVELERRQPEDKVRRPAVADHALGAAGEMPALLAHCARRGRVVDVVRPGRAAGFDQRRVGLLVVPGVGVSSPLALLPDHEPRLDPPARRRVASLGFQCE